MGEVCVAPSVRVGLVGTGRLVAPSVGVTVTSGVEAWGSVLVGVIAVVGVLDPMESTGVVSNGTEVLGIDMRVVGSNVGRMIDVDEMVAGGYRLISKKHVK